MSTSLIDKVSIWAKNAQFWLMPGVCVVCQQLSGASVDLCPKCRASLVALELPCTACALPLPPGDYTRSLCGTCQDPGRLIYQTLAGFAYQPPVAGLIGQFKYQGKLQHGRVLTDLLLEDIRRSYASTSLPQLLLPVPLHPARLRERGYNQALLMAQQLGGALQIPVVHDVLQRVINTSAQQGLSARERKHNLRRAFALTSSFPLQDLASIALIDDVVTTMSTVTELARLIRTTVGTELAIHVWCLARA
jgi:ComF family protein